MAHLAVHVTPKAGRDEIVGWRGGELQIKVSVPPEGGKANAAACALVADRLGVAKSSVRVTRGQGARHKQLDVAGIEPSELAAVLGTPDATLF